MDSKDYAAIIVFHTKDLKPEGIKYLVEDVNNSTWLLPLEDQKFYWSNEILRQEADRFTNDASKAWLFGTKEDARAMLVYLFNTLPGYDVTEHEFVAPAPAIEGKEEDKNVVLRWVKASGRLPTKFGMYVCIVKVYDDGHTFTPASFVQFDTIKGDWSNPSACGAEGKVLEWLEEISPPTPPAGAEGDGEKKSVHPEDLKQVEKTIREALDTHLSIRGPGIPVAANHVSGKEKAANYLALWMTGFWSAMDEGAEQWRNDFMGATEKLCAAQTRIAELEQTIREQKEWINSHR